MFSVFRQTARCRSSSFRPKVSGSSVRDKTSRTSGQFDFCISRFLTSSLYNKNIYARKVFTREYRTQWLLHSARYITYGNVQLFLHVFRCANVHSQVVRVYSQQFNESDATAYDIGLVQISQSENMRVEGRFGFPRIIHTALKNRICYVNRIDRSSS